MALDLGAAVAGHWSGAHAVAWDLNAPPFGDLDVGDRFQKHNYPFGIVVNARGERFLDEGLDFHSYTYAKYGGEILNQPGMFAWQIFDQKVTHLLREEYRIPRITKEKADSFEALAQRLEGVDPRRFLETVRAFNAAPRPEVPFNPNIRDGLATSGLAIDKTNWAQRLDTATLRGLCRDDRHHLHLRRPQDHRQRRGRRHLRPPDPRPLRRRRNRRRPLFPQLRQRHGPHVRRRLRPPRGEGTQRATRKIPTPIT